MIDGFHALDRRKHERCLACDKPDWCLNGNDMDRCLCQRINSSRRWKGAGWLHVFGSDPKPIALERKWTTAPKDAPLDVSALMSMWHPDRVNELAVSLGVSAGSLVALNAGWATEYSAWAFPMSNAQGIWTGVRLRNMAGEKWAVRGSKSGVFLPVRWSFNGPLIIVEGPTDSAAVLTWGFDVIGRPSCNDGGDIIAGILKTIKRDVVILANLDEPKTRPDGGVFYPGQEGAAALADLITWNCRSLKVITPPAGIKDARKWLGEGGTRRDVETMMRDKGQWKPTRRTA